MIRYSINWWEFKDIAPHRTWGYKVVHSIKVGISNLENVYEEHDSKLSSFLSGICLFACLDLRENFAENRQCFITLLFPFSVFHLSMAEVSSLWLLQIMRFRIVVVCVPTLCTIVYIVYIPTYSMYYCTYTYSMYNCTCR